MACKNLVLILVLIFSTGCGVKIIEKNDCIPKIEFVSTKSVRIHLIDVLEKSFSYSDLRIENNEKFLCVSTPNILDCDDSFGKLKVTELPDGTKLQLTGIAKMIKPVGLSTAFKSELIYLQGIVNKTIVWFPLFELGLFAEYNSESKLNAESSKILGIDSLEYLNNLKCFN